MEEHGMKLFENTVMRKIFGPKWDGSRLLSEEL
jgi:hypothetical protein